MSNHTVPAAAEGMPTVQTTRPSMQAIIDAHRAALAVWDKTDSPEASEVEREAWEAFRIAHASDAHEAQAKISYFIGNERFSDWFDEDDLYSLLFTLEAPAVEYDPMHDAFSIRKREGVE